MTTIKNNINFTRYNIARAQALAEGLWPFIFNSFGININFNPKIHTPCPKHGGKDGFRVLKDFKKTGGVVCNTCGIYPNGFKALCWLLNLNLNACIRQVVDLLDKSTSVEAKLEAQKVEVEAKADKAGIETKANQKKAEKQFKCSVAVEGWIAEGYLRKRGIPPIFNTFSIRFNNNVFVKTKAGVLEKLPALVCAVRDKDMNIITVHKTFLDVYKKSNRVENPKILAPLDNGVSIKGCAIYPRNKLPTDDTILVAEGVETALSIYWEYKGTFTAALISSTIMPEYIPPKGIKKVVVFADKDRSGLGESKALKLCDNLRKLGYKTAIALPKEDIAEGKKSIDWNDVLVNGGQFPDYELIANL